MVGYTPEEADAAIDRYCGGRMSPGELAEFEERLVCNPSLAQQVDVRLRLRCGLKELERRNELDELLVQRSRARLLPLAAAASVLIIVAAAVLYRTMRSTDIPVATSLAEIATGTPALSQISTHLLAGTRAAAKESEILVPRETRVIVLQILPDQATASGRYQVHIESAPARARSSDTPVTADSDGFVRIFLDAPRIPPGRYDVVVAPADGVERGTERYRIQVTHSQQ